MCLFFQAEDGIRDIGVTGVQTCALPILLVSVRSGAAASMPGMMETVLNVGLNDESVRGLAAQSGSERFAWDSYRRLIQMFGKTVLDRKSTRLNSSHANISYAVFCLKKKKKEINTKLLLSIVS